MEMTSPEPDTVNTRWSPIILAFAVLVFALATHLFTLARVQSWRPGYPAIVVFGTFTPPGPIRTVHRLGPFVGMMAFVGVVLASFRSPMLSGVRVGRRVVAWVSGSALAVLLLLYAWALLWVVRVSRYAG